MCFAFFRRKKNPPVPDEPEQIIENIRELYFRYRSGDADVRYELDERDGAYDLYVRLEGESADDAVTVPVGEDAVEEIADLLNTYDVLRWDGFHESERGLTGGDRFTFSVYYGDGNGVSADGYMCFPDTYDEVREGLDEIFRRLRDNAAQP